MSLTFSAQSNTLNTTGDKMKIGDLVRHIYDNEIYIVMSKEFLGYHDVSDSHGRQWQIPKEHLEVIK